MSSNAKTHHIFTGNEAADFEHYRLHRWRINDHVAIPHTRLQDIDIQAIKDLEDESRHRYIRALRAGYDIWKDTLLSKEVNLKAESEQSAFNSGATKAGLFESDSHADPELASTCKDPEDLKPDRELCISNQKSLHRDEECKHVMKEIEGFMNANPFSLHVYSVTLTLPKTTRGCHNDLMQFFKRTYRPDVCGSVGKVDSAILKGIELKNQSCVTSNSVEQTSLNEKHSFDWKKLAMITTGYDELAQTSSYTFCYFPALIRGNTMFSPLVVRDVTIQIEGLWIERAANRFVGMLPESFYKARAVRDGRLHHITLFHPLSSSQKLREKLYTIRPWDCDDTPSGTEKRWAENFMAFLKYYGDTHGFPVSLDLDFDVGKSNLKAISSQENPLLMPSDSPLQFDVRVFGVGRLAQLQREVEGNPELTLVHGFGDFPCKLIKFPGVASSTRDGDINEEERKEPTCIPYEADVKSIAPLSSLPYEQDKELLSAETYFVCVEWKSWATWMNAFEQKQDLHITLGFYKCDVHSGSKNAKDSLIIRACDDNE